MSQQQSSQIVVDDADKDQGTSGDNTGDNIGGDNTGDNTGGDNTGDNTGDEEASVLKDAVVPSTDDLEFNFVVNGYNIDDNTSFNESLNSLFNDKENDILTWLTNKAEYKNVSISYVENSANSANKTFEMLVTPLDGHAWADGSVEAKKITISLNPITVKDASAPTSDTLSGFYFNNLTFDVTGNASFNNKLADLFTVKEDYTISNGQFFLVNKAQYKNVSVSYVKDSANYDANSFKILATPEAGHAWADGSTEGKTITVVATNLSKSFANPIVSGGTGIHDYIKSDPQIYIANNTNSSVTYEVRNLSVDLLACPYGYTTYWQSSTDNGATWVDGGNLSSTVTVNKGIVSKLLLRFVVDFSSFKFVTASFEAICQ